MVDISEKLHKRIANKFPVMNVIIGTEEDRDKGQFAERVIGNHKVTLAIGTSNVYIINAEIIEND